MSYQELITLKHTLRFNANGKFRILMMSDLHGGVGSSPQLPEAIEALVDNVKPDLVLLGGDTAGPGRIHVETVRQLRELLKKVTLPMEKRAMPWAHVFGNHDNNFGLTNEQQESVYESFPYCVSKFGDKGLRGAGNYVLPIKASKSEKVAFNVFGLDSHGNMNQFGMEFGHPDMRYVLPNHFCLGRDYDTVHFEQVMWYYNTSKKMEEHNGAKIPALMYMHIPIPEFCLIDRNPEECGYQGNQREDVGCGEMNSGLFSACLQRGDVKAIFCGHDHVNDFYGTYCGIMLGYDAGMDYDAYQQDDLRGARVFDIVEDDTWHIQTSMVRVADIMGERGNKISNRKLV